MVIYNIYGIPIFGTGAHATGRAKSQENKGQYKPGRAPAHISLILCGVFGFCYSHFIHNAKVTTDEGLTIKLFGSKLKKEA